MHRPGVIDQEGDRVTAMVVNAVVAGTANPKDTILATAIEDHGNPQRNQESANVATAEIGRQRGTQLRLRKM